MTNISSQSSVRLNALGRRVQGATKTVPQNATQTVFTVTGGRILLTSLYGQVTTVIAGTTPSAKYVATPTVGTANNVCAAVAITAAEVGCMMSIAGKTTDNLNVVPAASGSVSAMAGSQIVAPGTIGFNTSAADTTGSVLHTLTYVPLDDGATVVAN